MPDDPKTPWQWSEERARQQALEAPPLPPKLTPEEIQRMTFKQRMDHIVKAGIASLKRYGGRPDLLLKECPWRDYQNPERGIAYQKSLQSKPDVS